MPLFAAFAVAAGLLRFVPAVNGNERSRRPLNALQLPVQDFNALGVATFIVDSFSSRGLTRTDTDQFLLGRLAMTVDAYKALEVVAKHPRVDPTRIVLMGFSRGGQSALYASMKRFHRMHGPAGLEYAAYLPLYPSCGTTFQEDDVLTDKPVRIFHGTADNYNLIAPCRAYVARLTAKGADIALTEYMGAGHVFDGRAFKTPLAVATWQTFRQCTLAESEKGVVVNTKTGQEFANGDPCIEIGPTVQYNESASVAVRKAVADFMITTVKAK